MRLESKIAIIIILLLCCKVVSYAQSNTAVFLKGTSLNSRAKNIRYIPKSRDINAREKVDNSKLQVTYSFECSKDPLKEDKWKELTRLEVGEHLSRYYSLDCEIYDSLYYASYEEVNFNVAVKDMRGPKRNLNETLYSYIDIYHHKSNNRRDVLTRFLEYDYVYNEPAEKLDWEILSDTDTVLGYTCVKAVANFRGRKWYAWFSFELPYNYGPWKLCELPGLILKVEDSKKLFQWTAVGIENGNDRPIYQYSKDKTPSYNGCLGKYQTKHSNRKEVDKLWRLRWIMPIFMLGQHTTIYDTNGEKASTNMRYSDKDQYYPRLELDN